MIDTIAFAGLILSGVSFLIATKLIMSSSCWGINVSVGNGEIELSNDAHTIDVEIKTNERGNLECDVNKNELFEIPLPITSTALKK